MLRNLLFGNRRPKIEMHFRGQPFRPRKDGFTLTESLVVLAVIAILAAFLLPVFSKAKRKAQGIFCLNNLKQLGISWVSYSGDNSERIPPNNGDRQLDYVPGGSPAYPQTWCAGWLNNSLSVPDNTNTASGEFPRVHHQSSMRRLHCDNSQDNRPSSGVRNH